MLPPILEIFAIWHPEDREPKEVAKAIVEHFRGNAFTGLIGGAVEVLIRSEGWDSPGDAPRPIPGVAAPLPHDLALPQYSVLVPLIGREMTRAVEQENSPWRTYIEQLVETESGDPRSFFIIPCRLSADADSETCLGRLLGAYQAIGEPGLHSERESKNSARCRDLTQGITQFLSGSDFPRITVFVSHTKRHQSGQEKDELSLLDVVRETIHDTRLQEYFDASDLQPGTDWDEELRGRAAESALLAVRSDLYATREWCQREVLIAKESGMPIVMIDARIVGEERGSYLLDHTPQIRIATGDVDEKRDGIYRALNALVDECLKRALWRCQQEAAGARPDLEIAWWAPHAPEAVTLLSWIDGQFANGSTLNTRCARILHPDPPLTSVEKEVLNKLANRCGLSEGVDIMTPRLLAARGG